ncbi:hypothetical protein AYO38_05570, partial [bacterium SCGC AG-212-C10]
MALRPAPATKLPRLEPGDRMTVEEFDRAYELRSDIHKAELVQGVVYVLSPVRIKEHSRPHLLLATWLGNYSVMHPGVEGGDDGSTRLSDVDKVQPDVMLWYEEGGNARIGPDQHLHGAPELVVEITASTKSYDLGVKKEAYRRAGVQEYVVWRTEEHAIDWFVLREGQYALLAADN